jgi:glyoxylase-like metal-dependent hydrolase (beta-lactamase superfamily II)
MWNRREFVLTASGGLLGALALPRRAAGRQADTVLANSVVRMADRVFLVTAGGTNVVALSTADGLVLVDSGSPKLTQPLMASLQQVAAGGRVRTVFNTHWHLENTGGNEALRQGGATIVAHENTRLWMATPTWIPAEDRYRTPRPQAARPTQSVRGGGTLDAGGEHLDYGYLIEAHTSGDIYVHLREANVLAVGDVAAPVRDPELDYFTGAWVGGRVDAMDRLLELSNDATRIVPGYGPAMTRAELRAERDVMKTIYDRAVDRVRESDDAEDMLKAGVLNGLGRTWKDPKKFLYDVNKGLWAHHNKLSPNVV